MSYRTVFDDVSKVLEALTLGQSVSVERILSEVKSLSPALADEELREVIALQIIPRGKAVAFGTDIRRKSEGGGGISASVYHQFPYVI